MNLASVPFSIRFPEAVGPVLKLALAEFLFFAEFFGELCAEKAPLVPLGSSLLH